jgi:tight adherence protein B
MDSFYYLFILFGFVAVVLAMEGGYTAWNNALGPDAQRLARRLRAMSAGERGASNAVLLKQRTVAAISPWERRLLSLPHMHRLERLLQQAGSTESVSHLLMKSMVAAATALMASHLLHAPLWLKLVATVAAAVFFPLRLLAARRARLRAFEQQLPDALDLLGRGLRAGHAFSGALEMVASESNEPIAGEFRIVFDEVNFGLSLHDALLNLATRVPSTDLRYFVIAVLLQRDTGGNLAELLDNLSTLIRARFKLLGTVRVLSAEGRLSAWVLSLLPFVAAALLNLVNPKFMSILWTDPAGLRLVWIALGMAAFGILWMWQIVKIRV